MTEIEASSLLGRLRATVCGWVNTPVDIAALAAFRIMFGLLMAGAMIRFLAKGWVNELYVLPKFHFPYDGFGWVQALPAGWMHAHFVALTILALMVALGFFYRAATILFCLGFTYVELIDQTTFLNHYYLISLLSGILIFLPAQRAWSIDVWRRPALKLEVVPAWTINLLRFQIAVVYLFAGLAKVNADWLLRAQPLRIWLAARCDLPVIGDWLRQVWVAYGASWFGAIYDLTIVFFLLRRRTRKIAFLAVIGFHVGTWLLFHIGMFPWIMIVATTVFFAPDWARVRLTQFTAKASCWLHRPSWSKWAEAFAVRAQSATPPVLLHPRLTVTLLILYVAAQVLLPLRPYLFGNGHPAWSCRGFNLAWQVMVAEKTGYVEFYARDPETGRRRKIAARDYLTPRQEQLMAQDPYLIRVLARKIATDLQVPGPIRAEIWVQAFATLNGRPSQRLINPDADLSGNYFPGWILPLQE